MRGEVYPFIWCVQLVMKEFVHNDFMLHNDVAKKLYHNHTEKMLWE
jgi:hypothetical protein